MEPIARRSARILVVDDEPTPRMAITEGLNLMGYQADEAASGEEALRRLAAQPYDLMLLDLRMPGLDGVEVMRRVRQIDTHLQVIVLTAYGSLESAIEAVRAGAADYLLKPCSLRDTEMAIAQALQKHREHLFISAESSARGPDRSLGSEPSRRILRRGPVTLDWERALVLVSGSGGSMSHAVQLTPSEAALLACLMQSPDTVRSCRALAHEALGYQVSEQEARELVRPHISRLRHKIKAVLPGPTLIRTVRSKGYLFSADLSPPLAH